MNNFLIKNARVWRAGEDALDPLSAFLCVRGGRIVALGHDRPAIARGLPEVDLGGRTVIPGLIDAHVHLELDPALRTPAEQLAVPDAEVRAAMAERAARMLAAGITTIRDCGGGRHREHTLREEIASGRRAGPRILCCGQPLTTPDGHCAFWGGTVATDRDIDRQIGRQVEAGSEWIKVMATGGVFTPGSSVRDSQFALDRLRAIVETAARAGRPVAAHCHGTGGIADALRAGVRTIEHASFAGPDGFGTALDHPLMDAMAQAEVWVSPTVNAGWGRRQRDDVGAPSAFFERMSKALRAQRDHGVRFIASTDAGIPGVAHHDLVDGLLAFQAYADLRPADVLRAATVESARALGLGDETGALAVGLSADLLIVPGDPLEDLAVLRAPECVVSRGRVLDRTGLFAAAQALPANAG